MGRRLVPVLLALAVGASVGAAQEKATELTAGVIGFSYTTCSGCDGFLVASTGGAENGVFSGFGGGTLSVGLYLSPSVALEPTASFSMLATDGETITILGIGAAVPYYFAKGWGRRGSYLAPRVTFNSLSGGGESVTQLAAGVALGTKVRLNDGAALRVQINFDYGFEGDTQATTVFGIFLGLSAFLK